MKKIIFIVVVFFVVCGCRKTPKEQSNINDNISEEQSDINSEVVTGAYLYYFTSLEMDASSYILEIDMFEEPQIRVKNCDMDEEKIYKITETKEIKALLKKMVVDDMVDNEDSKNEQGVTRILWSLNVTVNNEKVYRKVERAKYPISWNDFFQILVDVTDAESTKDFGWE